MTAKKLYRAPAVKSTFAMKAKERKKLESDLQSLVGVIEWMRTRAPDFAVMNRLTDASLSVGLALRALKAKKR